MKFESRFNLGQNVWYISNHGCEIYGPCPSCVGGSIPLPDGKKLSCPRCNSKGTVSIRHAHRWRVAEKMTIGQVRVQAGGTEEDDQETYMCHQSGIGSGSVYYAKDLFPAQEEAQRECDKRNLDPGKEWACVRCHPEFETVQYSGYNDWRWCYIHERRENHVDAEKAREILAQREKNRAETE